MRPSPRLSPPSGNQRRSAHASSSRPPADGAAFDRRPKLEVDREEAGLIRVSGELDLATAPTLRDALSLALTQNTSIELDLAGLQFCDSSGLRVLLDVARALESRNGTLTLARPPSSMRRLLDVTGVLRRGNIALADAR